MGETPFKHLTYRYYSGKDGDDISDIRVAINKYIDTLDKKAEIIRSCIDKFKGFHGYISSANEKLYRRYQNEYDRVLERKEALLTLDYSKPYIVVVKHDEAYFYECEIKLTDSIAQVNFDPEMYKLFTFSSDTVKGYEIKLHKKFGDKVLEDEYTFNGIYVIGENDKDIVISKFNYHLMRFMQYRDMPRYLRSLNNIIVVTNNFKDIDLANKLLSSSLYTCKGCKSKYYIDEDTIKWYKDKNYHIPRRCPDCIANKKKKKS